MMNACAEPPESSILCWYAQKLSLRAAANTRTGWKHAGLYLWKPTGQLGKEKGKSEPELKDHEPHTPLPSIRSESME